VRVLCLEQHAGYRCRHSGACCTSNWPIPIEEDRARAVRRAIEAGRLQGHLAGWPPGAVPLISADDLPPGAGAILDISPSGACAFYDRDERRCAIHRELGHGALPSACQHFPRRCLIERDAVFVSLSHYCPTVAHLTFSGGPERGIAVAPDSLAGHLHLEGLDARDVLPPLLRPGMLTDLDGYHAWESAVVNLLESGLAPETALAGGRTMTARVQSWSPAQGLLVDAVDRAAAEGRAEASSGDGQGQGPDVNETELRAAFALARMAVPEALRPVDARPDLGEADRRWVASAWPSFAAPLGRFLAAHAFGAWGAYLGSGLVTVVRGLEVALAVVRVEAARRCAQEQRPLDRPVLVDAFRAADLLLVHLADPKALAQLMQRDSRQSARVS